MMDSGQIDFYQHDYMCSNTCRSTKFEVLINGTRPSPGTSVQPGLSHVAPEPSGGQVPPTTGMVYDSAEERLENESRAAAGWSNGLPRLVNFTTSSWHSLKRKRADTPDGVLRLWKGVADSGLMGEVLSSLQRELLRALQSVELCREKVDLQETEAFMLNSLCEMFGLLDSVKQTVDMRCRQSEESKIHNRVYAPNDVLGDRRKLSCSKNRSYRNSSSKHLWSHCQSRKNSRTQPSTAKTNTGIHSPSDVDLQSASYNRMVPQSSSFTEAIKAYRDGRDRMREPSAAGNQEPGHRQRQEDTTVRLKENGQKTDQHCQSKREDARDNESSRKTIREEEKHKSKGKI
ncbi:glucocorticoid modulatory element-binding protein 1 [Oryzias melastigma]|uniref:glucocorticoid modulatory element-binding protein 1 n=1 Tax=Oryzias melastigma TaxID=30732 RepID=UPI000CF7D611|nr:glucocorticoid modulatory element-binding protein 1 [Oryzias melastigma]